MTSSEEGITARRAVTRRGGASVNQTETIHVFSADKMRLPVVKRKYFTGTSLGNTISEVPVPAVQDLWHLPNEIKKALYDKYRVAVGGRDPDGESEDVDSDEAVVADEEEVTPVKKRRPALQAAALEPVFYHEVPKTLCEELLHMYRVKAIIDLTAGAGTWALCALQSRIPYFGVTLTEIHLEELLKMLEGKIVGMMQTEGSPLYSPGFAGAPASAASAAVAGSPRTSGAAASAASAVVAASPRTGGVPAAASPPPKRRRPVKGSGRLGASAACAGSEESPADSQ